MSNPYDKPNHELCTSRTLKSIRTDSVLTLTDDPALFTNQPLCVQVIGRPFNDEELIEISSVVGQYLEIKLSPKFY